MTVTRPKAWVGDQVHDVKADKEGVVTDVKSDGSYLLRPLYMWSLTWTVPNADGLEITESREEQSRRRRGES
ncbi:hypothetical protein [Streptomyces sp. B21-083]|uniref:hypothetical protein n=1 Tax=Streptomyces sp. B21-083 TaxID=3039410 RepID=UPI002FF045D7